jgi:hypothetical protein
MNDIKRFNSQVEFVNNEREFLDSPNEETVIVILNQTEAIYGADDSCNTQYCDEHNIPYAHQGKLQRGGCIIGVKGNIFIDAKRKLNGGECIADTFSKALAQYFKGKGLESARCDNNDVLVDGYKVASGCETIHNGFNYMGYQISLYQDLETIKNVCNKPMVKIPKALSEYGITTDEMVHFIEEYWNNK